MYVDNILLVSSALCLLHETKKFLSKNFEMLASSDLGLLHETKKFLSKNFEMEDMDEATYVIGIEIFQDRSRGLLGLSQKAYIERVLQKFKIVNCSASVAPIQKSDKFSLMQCPQNEWERKQMEGIPYASVVGSLMYAQTCTRSDISFTVGMLGRYQSKSRMNHWKVTKKVMSYLQGTKDFMLTFRRSDSPEVIGYSDSDFAGCIDSRKSTFGYLFTLARGAISWKSVKQTIILHPLWKLNLWHALRPQFMDCGCRILSQDLGLLTFFPNH